MQGSSCRRCRQSPCRSHTRLRTPQWRLPRFRSNRIRLLGCRCSRIRTLGRDRCIPCTRPGPDAVVFVVADAVVVHVGQAIAVPFAKNVKDISAAVARAVLDLSQPHSKMAPGPLHSPHSSTPPRTHPHRRRCRRRRRPQGKAATHPQGIVDVAVAVAFAVLDLSQPHSKMALGPLHCRIRPILRRSRPRRRRCRRRLVSRQGPPHTPKASTALPSQSHMPSARGLQPHSYTAPGPLQMPQASRVPTHSSTSSHTPSPSSSASHVPPHVPRASSCSRCSRSSSGMSTQPHA